MKKIAGFLKKVFSGKKKAANQKKHLKPRKKSEIPPSEFEAITDKIIYDTIGPQGSMNTKLEELLSSYKAENNPIGVDVAKKIIKTLISDAISQRYRLLVDFGTAIKKGEITSDYYEKVKAIQRQEARSNAAISDAAFIEKEALDAKAKLEEIENADREAKGKRKRK